MAEAAGVVDLQAQLHESMNALIALADQRNIDLGLVAPTEGQPMPTFRCAPSDLGGTAAVGLLILRLVAGAAIALHGWPKIQSATSWMGPDAPVPGVLQLLAALAEFGGGICWVLGLLTPLASFDVANAQRQ